MSKTRINFIFGFFALFIGIAVTTACLSSGKHMAIQPKATPTPQNAPGLQLEIPDAPWEPAFFNALEERAKTVSLPSLRTVVLPEHDLEARFWYDHFEVISGLIIRRSGNKWFAIGLRQIHDHLPSSIKQEDLRPPRSGWKDAWKKLVDAGVLTLPDASKAGCRTEVLDGLGYVVETNVNRKYRTYRYGNPAFAKCDEAKQMILVGQILGDEFSFLDSKHR